MFVKFKLGISRKKKPEKVLRGSEVAGSFCIRNLEGIVEGIFHESCERFSKKMPGKISYEFLEDFSTKAIEGC